MTHEQIICAFSILLPWLAVSCALAFLFWPPSAGVSTSPVRTVLLRRAWLPVATLALVLLPCRSLPLGRWVAGCNANFSIPLTLWVGLNLLERLSGRRILRRSETAGFWRFGLAAGLFLFPLALGLTPLDSYSLGWKPGGLLTVMVVLTIALLAAGNRFAIWIMLSLLACNLRLLESPNLWDYLVDPFYFIASLVMATVVAVRRVRGRTTCAA